MVVLVVVVVAPVGGGSGGGVVVVLVVVVSSGGVGSGSFFTESLFTVSVAVCPFPSLTVSLNVKISPFVPTSGAVNVGVALLASRNVATVVARDLSTGVCQSIPVWVRTCRTI